MLNQPILAKESNIQSINLNDKLIGGKIYLKTRVITISITIVAHYLVTKRHIAESIPSKVNAEVESS